MIAHHMLNLIRTRPLRWMVKQTASLIESQSFQQPSYKAIDARVSSVNHKLQNRNQGNQDIISE